MTRTTIRTFYYTCPSCGNTGEFSKSKSFFFESLDLKDSDYPRCLKCKTIICGTCAMHGLCDRCYDQISPKLIRSLNNIHLISKIAPFLISAVFFFVLLFMYPNGIVIVFLFGAIILALIIKFFVDPINISIQNSKIKKFFRNIQSKNKSSYVHSNAYNKPGKRNENSKKVINSLNSEVFSTLYDPYIQPKIPHIKEVIRKISKTQKNKEIAINVIGTEAGVPFPFHNDIRKLLLEMINNKEIKAQFDYNHNFITFY